MTYNYNQKGFTLIELLIVIAVIAILAVAILSAINPVEQLRKADDSRRRSDTAELLNSLERYYSTYRQYPWGTGAPSVKCPILDGYNPSGNAAWNCTAPAGTINVQGLVSQNELKLEFRNRHLNDYFITEDTASNQVHICFVPMSTTWNDPNVAKFSGTGGTWTSGQKYVCVPE